MALETINPATQESLGLYEETTEAEVSTCLEKSREVFQEWECSDWADRAGLLQAVASELRNGVDELARLIALEMGKPIGQAEGEIEKCAWVCDYYAEHGAEFLTAQSIATEASASYVCFRPLGSILAVMPWNFPFWQVFRAVVPAIMAGNTVVLKHASNVSGCALAISDLFRKAGAPEGLLSALILRSDKVASIIEDPMIQGVTLTGSEAAGRAIAEKAGRALKKTVMELGGSDPYIVLEDADVEDAAATCVQSRLINSGQSCIAAKRFIVVESIYKDFEAAMMERLKAARVGEPFEQGVQVGPLAREDLRETLHRQVSQSTAKGATCRLGGHYVGSKGYYYAPTLVTDVGPGLPVYQEETFGPVAALIRAKGEKEAVAFANDTSYGLGAAVLTGDPERGERIARDELQAGCCFVNDLVKSDPRLPFGGVKQSGYGRELSEFGIREFVNIKTVVRR